MRQKPARFGLWFRQLVRLASVLGVLLLIFGGLFLWRDLRRNGSAKAATNPAPALPVATAIATTGSEPVYLDAVGSLEAVRQVTMAPEVAGRVVEISFTAGTTVRKGDALVQLYDEPERAELASLNAKATFTKAQLARSEELAPTGAQPRTTLDQRRSEFDQANADIRRTRALITQKTVRAPFSGELGLRRINLGQYLNAGDPVATLTDLRELYANFALPQQALGQLRTGQRVEVRIDAFPSRTFEGRVTALEPQVAGDTRNVTVQATLANPDLALRPGLFVQVRLVLPSQLDVITVPETAILSSADGSSVIRVAKVQHDVGVAEIVPVQVGRHIGDRIMVNGGLAVGDVIVTTGQVRVSPGARVKVAAEEPAR